jgi:hypothetical protein
MKWKIKTMIETTNQVLYLVQDDLFEITSHHLDHPQKGELSRFPQ